MQLPVLLPHKVVQHLFLEAGIEVDTRCIRKFWSHMRDLLALAQTLQGIKRIFCFYKVNALRGRRRAALCPAFCSLRRCCF